jgi:hypothetical protein
MILERRSALKPLIKSSGGVHLTAYLRNTGDRSALKAQIEAAIIKADSEIGSAMPDFDRRLFLAPLRLLLTNDKLLKSLKNNIGLFRTAKLFRLLALPIEIEESCVVATSFHVKPLLRWVRVDKDFLIMGVEGRAVHLFQGTQHSLRLIGSLEVSDDFLKIRPKNQFANSNSRVVARATPINEVVDWLAKQTRLTKPKLYFAGDPIIGQAIRNIIHYPSFMKPVLSDSFAPDQVTSLCLEIRTRMESEAISDLEKVVTEFHFAEDNRAARRNIFQIAKAVAQGRVRKLMVADGIKIFGRFNSKTGALAIHPRDLDHEDDDILDDLAQSVLAKGGEVIVASKEDIPDGHLAWALLDHPTSEIGLSTIFERPYFVPKEREAI